MSAARARLGVLLCALAGGAAPARAECVRVDFAHTLAPTASQVVGPTPEVRFSWPTRLQGESMAAVDEQGEVFSLVTVDEPGFVLRAPSGLPAGTYSVQRGFRGCVECTDAVGTFVVDPAVAASVPARPTITGAVEVDIPPNLEFCHEQFEQFNDDPQFAVNPRRWVRVDYEAPADEQWRPEVVARFADPETGLARLARATSPTTEMERGPAIAFPVAAVDRATAVDVELWFVNLDGQAGPSSEVHLTLAATPAGCPPAGCGTAGNGGAPFIGCAEPVASPQPGTRDLPVEGLAALFLFPLSFLRKRR